MFSLSCIKCGTKYQSKDDDPYFCPSCLSARKVLEREIDAKVGSTVGQVPNSDWQKLERGEKLLNGQIWLPSKRIK